MCQITELFAELTELGTEPVSKQHSASLLSNDKVLLKESEEAEAKEAAAEKKAYKLLACLMMCMPHEGLLHTTL